MATVVANKPAPPHQKMKRPPPPTVQTNANGVKSSHSSPSPSLTSKRPPSGVKHPPSAAAPNSVNGSVNGTGSRLSNRRREQKPGDIQTRPNRPGKNGLSESIQERRKKMAEPYVKAASFILKKFRKAVPSLVIHLHPTHFRFDQQDGSFSYTSPMKVILEHLKLQTVPHDMVDELHLAGVKFYDGCLIVQVQDHRNSSSTSRTSEAAQSADGNAPFSIHNYNQYLTPSSYAPYPKSNDYNHGTRTDMQKSQSREGTSDAAKETSQSQSLSKASTKGPKVFTTVLFPSPLSMEEEVFLYANTPDPRSNKGKQAQGGGLARTPASATLTHPPTPLSAVSPTPANPPPNKKQKMLVKEGDVRDFHSKLVNSTAGPLYLEPVHSLQEARNLIEILTDDQHKGSYPAPRTRKRTVAELEADEALAASEQRFMLIMDERLASSASGAAGKSNGADGEVGVASFEPSFGRFKAIEAIRLAQQEREQRAQEAKAHETAIKVRQEQAERLKRENDKKMEAISRDVQQQQQQQQKMSLQAFQSNRVHQAANLASLQQQGRMASSQNLHAHGPTSNNIMQNQQNMPPNTQAQHSSPVVRQLTPHSNPRSSPLVGSLPTNHTPHSVPMNVTSSGQGATSSPARPPSAAQHGHPGGAAMVRQRSQQRPPSRMGTPQMPNGTPGMQNVTPVMNHATPNPRMTQTSPPVSMANPSVKHNALGAQHLTNQQMSVAEQNANMLRYRQQLQLQQHQPQLQQHQPQLQTAMMPSAHQMSPNHAPPSTPNLQQLAAQNQQRQYNEYQQQLNNHHRQMNLSNGVSPPHPQPHPGHQPPRPPPGTQQSNAAALRGHYQAQLANQILNKMKQNLVMAHGSPANVPPEKIEEARNRATQMARDQMMRNAQFAQAHQNAQMAHNPQNQQQNILLRQQQQQNQATVFAHMGVNGMGGGINGMNNLNGMNLGGGMNGMGGVNGMGGMGGGGMNGMG